MLNTPVGRLRAVGFVEGMSFLVLLFIAMPLKYGFGMPGAVRAVGSLHGFLWILFLASVVEVWLTQRWPLMRVAGAFVASVVPFGTFVLDRSLRREEEAAGGEVARAA